MSNAPPRRFPAAERGVARGRPTRAGLPAPPSTLDVLLAHLESTSVRAELQVVDAQGDERDALALLGQTARALHALVWPVRAAGTAELWDTRRRVTRMRTWLRARADGGASPALAVSLCEHALQALTTALRAGQRAAGRRPNDTAEFEAERA